MTDMCATYEATIIIIITWTSLLNFNLPSLVKDASPAKTLHLENSEAVQEESSHTTYASFGKRTYTTAWSVKGTHK